MKHWRKETILCYALMAKNSMMNRNSYAPFHIVMGENNFVLGLEDETKEESKQCIPFKKIRQKYLESESETNVNMAMKSNKRKNAEFIMGEWVKYYTQAVKTKSSWRGPAKIIGKDGDQYILKHGGNFIYSHLRDLRKFRKDEDFGMLSEKANQDTTKTEMTNVEENNNDQEKEQIFVKRFGSIQNFGVANKVNACSCEFEDTLRIRAKLNATDEIKLLKKNKHQNSYSIVIPCPISGEKLGGNYIVNVLLQIGCDYCLNFEQLRQSKMSKRENTVIYEMCIDTPPITHGELINFIHVLEKAKCQINDYKPSDRNTLGADGSIKSPEKTSKRPFPLTTMPSKVRRTSGTASFQPKSSSDSDDRFQSMTDSSDEEDDESQEDETPEKLKSVERYLNSEVDTSELSAALRSSGDEIPVKNESIISEIDNHDVFEEQFPQTSSSATNMTQQKASRRRQPPQFYGIPIQSTTKGLIGLLREEGPKSYVVRDDERKMNRSLIEKATEAEIQGWRDYEVMREVPISEIPMGYHIISTIWVDVWKEAEMGKMSVKSRLCVRGNEEKIKIGHTFAPTVSRDILFSCLTIMISKRWKIQSIDVEKAFLQSGTIDRKVFVRPPSEAGVDDQKVWQLNVAAYGLTDAARKWYLRLKETLVNCGLKMCEVEPAVFYMKDANDCLKGIMVTHVDDFLIAGEGIFLEATKMKTKIKIGKCVDYNFKFCGLEITSKKDGSLKVKLESGKAGEITKMPTDGLTERRMTAQEETTVRGKIGQLQWYASVCRPDLSFLLGDLLSTPRSTLIRFVRQTQSSADSTNTLITSSL